MDVRDDGMPRGKGPFFCGAEDRRDSAREVDVCRVGRDGVPSSGVCMRQLVPDVRDESFEPGFDDREPRREVPSVNMFRGQLNPPRGSFQPLFPHGLSPTLHLDDRGLNVLSDNRIPPDFGDSSLNMRHDVRLQHRRPVHVCRFTHDALPRRDEVGRRDERVQFGIEGRLGGGRVWRGAGVE